MAVDIIVRASSLPQYPDCPKRWAAQAMPEEIRAAGFTIRDETRGIGAIIGTSTHKSAEIILREKAASGKLPPATVAADSAMATLKEEMAAGAQFDQRYTRSPAEAEQQTHRMALAYHAYVAPKIEPILIEERLEHRVPHSRQLLVLSGQADVVAREPNAIRDQKGGTRAGNYNAQAGAYSLLAQTEGIKIDEAIIDWVPRAPVKHPQPRPIEWKLPLATAESSAINTLRHIDEDLTVWREGDPQRNLHPGDPAAFLSNPQSILCRERYCRAYGCTQNAWCNDWRKEA